MKTSLALLVTVFMVFAAIEAKSQVTSSKTNPKSKAVAADNPSNRDADMISSGGGTASDRMRLTGIESQIYVGSNWPEGTVLLRDGGIIDGYLLRYDILADQMQFISGNDTMAFASPDELKTITFDGYTFVYEMYRCENTVRNGYFELIQSGKNRLLLKRLVTYMMPDLTNPEKAEETTYYVDECYFISKPGEPACKVMCNRKSALSFLNEHNAEIEEYLHITGNKVKTPEDLKNLVAYYNSLEPEP